MITGTVEEVLAEADRLNAVIDEVDLTIGGLRTPAPPFHARVSIKARSGSSASVVGGPERSLKSLLDVLDCRLRDMRPRGTWLLSSYTAIVAAAMVGQALGIVTWLLFEWDDYRLAVAVVCAQLFAGYLVLQWQHGWSPRIELRAPGTRPRLEVLQRILPVRFCAAVAVPLVVGLVTNALSDRLS